jgi:hypothetical protein
MPIVVVQAFYRRGTVVYTPGQRMEVSDDEAAYLLRDAPGCFAVDAPTVEASAIDAPPAAKVIRRAPRTKGGAS